MTILLDSLKSLGTRADGVFIINSRSWENVKQMMVVSDVDFIQVILMVHGN